MEFKFQLAKTNGWKDGLIRLVPKVEKELSYGGGRVTGARELRVNAAGGRKSN